MGCIVLYFVNWAPWYYVCATLCMLIRPALDKLGLRQANVWKQIIKSIGGNLLETATTLSNSIVKSIIVAKIAATCMQNRS